MPIKLHTDSIESDEDKQSAQSETELPGSVLAKSFIYNYLLKVYVKYDGFGEFGEGKCVVMPIRIVAVQKLVQSEDDFRVPPDWNPVCGGDMKYLYMED